MRTSSRVSGAAQSAAVLSAVQLVSRSSVIGLGAAVAVSVETAAAPRVAVRAVVSAMIRMVRSAGTGFLSGGGGRG